MGNERLERFTIVNDWREDEDAEVTDRPGMGADLAEDYDRTPGVFGYLQTLIAGEGAQLPHATPFVRIVTGRDGWKEDFALVYGYPALDPDQDPALNPAYATRIPEEASTFKIYYGANYGLAGYTRVETVQGLDPEVAQRLESGNFTDDEAEQLLEQKERYMTMYTELLVAARDAQLNPEYGERVLTTFYHNAAEAGLG